MIYFDIDNERYRLQHNNADDSRTVVRCDDEDFQCLLRIDSSLNVTKDGEHHRLGILSDNWVLYKADGSVAVLKTADAAEYDWRSILQAEVAAAKHLLA